MKAKAIAFPGQGAQYSGMGKDLYDHFPEAREIFSRIEDFLEFKISQICFEGTEDDLKKPHFQQLAIIAASLAAYEVFKKRNIKVDFLSGLSLGEYTCLYPAGVLSLKDLIYLIRMRAEVTEHVSDLCPSSMLAVVGLDRSQLMLEGERQGFYIANINSPQQMVVSLKQEEKARVKNSLEDLGAKVIELDVTGGFHSPLMEPVKQQFKKFIDKLEFKKAKIPIVSNVTAMAHTDKSEIKSNLTEEMTSPVLWRDCVDFMLKGGVDIFFEIGPSQIVRGLIKKINPGVNIVNLEKKDDFEKLVQYQ